MEGKNEMKDKVEKTTHQRHDYIKIGNGSSFAFVWSFLRLVWIFVIQTHTLFGHKLTHTYIPHHSSFKWTASSLTAQIKSSDPDRSSHSFFTLFLFLCVSVPPHFLCSSTNMTTNGMWGSFFLSFVCLLACLTRNERRRRRRNLPFVSAGVICCVVFS